VTTDGVAGEAGIKPEHDVNDNIGNVIWPAAAADVYTFLEKQSGGEVGKKIVIIYYIGAYTYVRFSVSKTRQS